MPCKLRLAAAAQQVDRSILKTCHVEITTQCSAIAQHYVLPGRTYTFTKEPDKVHSFVLQEGRAERTISFSTT
ncbi:hypothetical protein C7A07_10665 [Pseudomonas fragi]|nr:hypothetical protein C7A07_10665 [Pseudomonas fragi]